MFFRYVDMEGKSSQFHPEMDLFIDAHLSTAKREACARTRTPNARAHGLGWQVEEYNAHVEGVRLVVD